MSAADDTKIRVSFKCDAEIEKIDVVYKCFISCLIFHESTLYKMKNIGIFLGDNSSALHSQMKPIHFAPESTHLNLMSTREQQQHM